VYNFDDPDLIQNRPALQRAFVISAGVIFNMILSWSAIFVSVNKFLSFVFLFLNDPALERHLSVGEQISFTLFF
jgi:hypothetical protein